MNEQDRARFTANLGWFNQFFGEIRQLYGIVVDALPNGFLPEGFALTSRNFYFTKQNSAPSIPPYYALMVGGERFALQVLAIFDAELFGRPGLFVAEPSLVVVLHSQAGRYAYMNDYALTVVRNREIEITEQADGRFRGEIGGKYPASFFSFQVPFDRFSASKNPREAVREHIVDPIAGMLEGR